MTIIKIEKKRIPLNQASVAISSGNREFNMWIETDG